MPSSRHRLCEKYANENEKVQSLEFLFTTLNPEPTNYLHRNVTMPDHPNNLLNLILAIAPCLVMAVCFVGIAALFFGVVFLFFKKSRAISTQAAQDLSQSSDEYFAEVTPQLLPWEATAPADLSAYLEYSSHAGRGRVHARGKVKSLSRPDAPGWLAFDLHIENFKGTMILKSAECDWQLQFLGLTAKETPVEVNGVPLGSIQQAREEILLLSADDRAIGRYRQHQLLGGLGGLTKYAQTPYFGPVELSGRCLAELNRNPILLKPLIGNASPPPLVKNLAANLTAEEEQWLVALVGWEILYRIVTR
jgi:hypothetical protein